MRLLRKIKRKLIDCTREPNAHHAVALLFSAEVRVCNFGGNGDYQRLDDDRSKAEHADIEDLHSIVSYGMLEKILYRLMRGCRYSGEPSKALFQTVSLAYDASPDISANNYRGQMRAVSTGGDGLPNPSSRSRLGSP
jgi:hypothetical protein